MYDFLLTPEEQELKNETREFVREGNYKRFPEKAGQGRNRLSPGVCGKTG